MASMPDRRFPQTWGPSGPRAMWRKQVGQGFAGPAVDGHRVGNEEVVESLEAASGSPR